MIERFGFEAKPSTTRLDTKACSEKHPVSTSLLNALQLLPLTASAMRLRASISSHGSMGLREISISVSPCRPFKVTERAARPSQPERVKSVKIRGGVIEELVQYSAAQCRTAQ